MLTLDNIHDPAGDIQEYQMFCLIADKIEADPGLLSIALDNLERWLTRSPRPHPEFQRWHSLVSQAMGSGVALRKLVGLLKDDSEPARQFKGFDPCPGILSKAELKRYQWTSRH